MNNSFINNWRTVIMMCMLLGLAPFVPEPHIWGKIKWIAGGAEGMGVMDYADVLMHGAPWLLLIRLSIITLFKKQQA